MISLNGTPINPTIFPDGTSQVWKLGNELLFGGECKVTWEFENEAEFMHLAQLKALLDDCGKFTELYVPYLPYARQDKPVSDTATFALYPFLRLLKSLRFEKYTAFDMHNPQPCFDILRDFINLHPRKEVDFAVYDSISKFVLYPDKGARDRYMEDLRYFCYCANKVRDPATGNILSIDLPIDKIRKNKSDDFLIVDDICDGGATFIEIAKQLPGLNVSLYVSHGIFSRGLQPLIDAGIQNIYTRKGKVN